MHKMMFGPANRAELLRIFHSTTSVRIFRRRRDCCSQLLNNLWQQSTPDLGLAFSDLGRVSPVKANILFLLVSGALTLAAEEGDPSSYLEETIRLGSF